MKIYYFFHEKIIESHARFTYTKNATYCIAKSKPNYVFNPAIQYDYLEEIEGLDQWQDDGESAIQEQTELAKMDSQFEALDYDLKPLSPVKEA